MLTKDRCCMVQQYAVNCIHQVVPLFRANWTRYFFGHPGQAAGSTVYSSDGRTDKGFTESRINALYCCAFWHTASILQLHMDCTSARWYCDTDTDTRRLARGTVHGNGKHVGVGCSVLHSTDDVRQLRSLQPACCHLGRRLLSSSRGWLMQVCAVS